MDTKFEIYKLHAEFADRAARMREGLNKLYSGVVVSIIVATVLLHRLVPDADAVWSLPVLGAIVALSWLASLHSITGRLIAKQAVLQDLETEMPFPFFTREEAEFNKLKVFRRKWSGLVMPLGLFATCVVWLIWLCFSQ